MDSKRESIRQVSQFAETDYRYGTGTLRIMIDHIDWSRPFESDGEHWYQVYGIEVTADDREIGSRQALVRGRRLKN